MRLSYSKIKTCLECPYKFKLAYIEKVPQKPKPYFKLANIIHYVLHKYHFYERKASLDDLLLCYERAWGLKKGIFYEEGKKILTSYYQNMRDQIPYTSEKRFTVRVEDNILAGKFDRIDKTKDGFKIIDYKLSKIILTPREVKESLQLSLYALAFFYLTGIVPLKVGFYFLRYGKMLFTKKTEKDLERTKNLIDDVAQKIIREEFYRKEGRSCSWCDYKESCLLEENEPTRKIIKEKPRQLLLPL